MMGCKREDLPMTGLDQKTNVGIHEWNGHGDVDSIGQVEIGMEAHLLDEREDV